MLPSSLNESRFLGRVSGEDEKRVFPIERVYSVNTYSVYGQNDICRYISSYIYLNALKSLILTYFNMLRSLILLR